MLTDCLLEVLPAAIIVHLKAKGSDVAILALEAQLHSSQRNQALILSTVLIELSSRACQDVKLCPYG